jgi:hypothetical protein
VSSATLYVYLGGKPLIASPDQIVIDESEGMHDMATLYFGGVYGRNLVAQFDLADVGANDIGPPAAIEFISNSVLTTFYGYIDTTVETRTIGESVVEVYFLNATSVMRSGTPRVWRDERPFDIAQDLLKPYGLGLEMDKIANPMASFSQSDQSDWEALRNLAVLNGLSLTATGPIVKLQDVINTTRRAKGSALTSRFRRPGTPERYNKGLEVTQFTQVASRTPLGGERYRYYGIDQLGVSFEVSGGVSAIAKSPGTVVKSLGAALRESRRHEAVGRFVTRATLDGPGLDGCSAGDCVIVDNDVDPEYWYVSSSKHTLTPKKDEHHMTLELCRQEGIAPGYISTTVPPRPGVVLIGKEWRADRSWAVEL